MPKLIPKNEATLRAILRLKEAGVHEVNAALGENAKDAIRSLLLCEYIQVTRSIMRQTVTSNPKHKQHTRQMLLYAITYRGRQKLQDMEFPPAREMKALKAVPVPKFDLHKMESFIIPSRDPNVREMMAEIGGREVKITYGVHHDYEVYRPAPDHSRNYTPRPLRSILAM